MTRIEEEGFDIKELHVPGDLAVHVAVLFVNRMPDALKKIGLTFNTYFDWPFKVRDAFLERHLFYDGPIPPRDFIKQVLLREKKVATCRVLASLGTDSETLPNPKTREIYQGRNQMLREILDEISRSELKRVWRNVDSGYADRFLQLCPTGFLPLALAEIQMKPDRFRYNVTDDSRPKQLIEVIEKRLKEV